MGSFKRAILGYRRDQVDEAMSSRDARIWALRRDVEDATERERAAAEAAGRAEEELTALSDMVFEREREIRALGERLREANERHDRSIASLHAVSARLEEIQEQARGQATRIRMKALREAVEVSRRTQDLAEVEGRAAESAGSEPAPRPADPAPPAAAAERAGAEAALGELFEGLIRLEIGPLGDFSQLVGFEDAVGRLGASQISVERFSEGRATVSMRLDEPVALLRELEESAPFDFDVRRTGDEVILDLDEDAGGPDQRAA